MIDNIELVRQMWFQNPLLPLRRVLEELGIKKDIYCTINHQDLGDESWCYKYDLESKRQTMQWGSLAFSHLKKRLLRKSRIKTFLVASFSNSMIHQEFVPEGQIVNAKFYKAVLKPLLMPIQRVRPQMY
ncbi:mariner Mos1 transposase [Nephila pilipes]|uniref:Mariner Mos1 transposase n=1 Tax=Nephila pilipes TaxID=299642 RepID=A0A8X6UHH4_NEPPI|nr:mariner Mos1 transposase [Nephila pilipes]